MARAAGRDGASAGFPEDWGKVGLARGARRKSAMATLREGSCHRRSPRRSPRPRSVTGRESPSQAPSGIGDDAREEADPSHQRDHRKSVSVSVAATGHRVTLVTR